MTMLRDIGTPLGAARAEAHAALALINDRVLAARNFTKQGVPLRDGAMMRIDDLLAVDPSDGKCRLLLRVVDGDKVARKFYPVADGVKLLLSDANPELEVARFLERQKAEQAAARAERIATELAPKLSAERWRGLPATARACYRLAAAQKDPKLIALLTELAATTEAEHAAPSSPPAEWDV